MKKRFVTLQRVVCPGISMGLSNWASTVLCISQFMDNCISQFIDNCISQFMDSCIYQKLNSLHCAEQLSWHSPKFVLRCQIKSAPAQPLLAHVCACVAYNGNTLFKFSLNGHANVLYWEQKNKNGKTCPPTYLVILGHQCVIQGLEEDPKIQNQKLNLPA